jgi:hypothetical protein
MRIDTLLAYLFFIGLLIIGLAVYDDYGISWDEEINHTTGLMSYNYIFHKDQSLFEYSDKENGVVVELPLILIEKALGLSDTRDIYLMRHLATFLLFYLSVCAFYFLGAKLTGSRRLALLGCVFLVFSPRIFADAFFNSKDICFMSMFIISMYTLVRYLERKTFLRIAIHSFNSALSIGIRNPGILIVAITLFPIALDVMAIIFRKRSPLIAVIRYIIASKCIIYIITTAFLTVIFWPYLWSDPVNHFVEALILMSHYTFYLPIFYMGGFVAANDLPWHYAPVWIVITTPPLYLLAGISGLFLCLKSGFETITASLMRSRPEPTSHGMESLLLLLWFFVPISIVIVTKSVIYDGWRQLFFIYPAFILIATRGIQ